MGIDVRFAAGIGVFVGPDGTAELVRLLLGVPPTKAGVSAVLPTDGGIVVVKPTPEVEVREGKTEVVGGG